MAGVFASEGAKAGERTCGGKLEALYLRGIAWCLHICYDHCIMLVFGNISSYLLSEVCQDEPNQGHRREAC